MAIDTTLFNPWASVDSNFEKINAAVDEPRLAAERRRLAQIAAEDRAQQLLERQRANAEYDRAIETREGLGKIMAQDTEQTPVAPEFSLAKAANIGGGVPLAQPQAPGYNLGQTQTRNIPYDERAVKGLNYLAGRGAMDQMKELGDSIDITQRAIDSGSMGMIDRFWKMAVQGKKAGLTDDQIKGELKVAAANINRMGGNADINNIDKWDLSRDDIGVMDLQDGNKAAVVTDPDGKTKLYLIKPNDTGYKEAKIDAQNRRTALGWASIDPDNIYARTVAKTEGAEQVKAKPTVIAAVESNKTLDDAERLFKANPANTVGAVNQFKAFIGKLDPALEEALNTGDRQTFERLMTSNMGSYKALLGPQISNADAALMSLWAGATDKSPASVQAGIDVMRRINNGIIQDYQARTSSGRQAAPQAIPYLKTGADSRMSKTKETKTMNSLPDAAQHRGKTIKSSTGRYLRSDGTNWVEVK